jgi:hypothetical protein
MRPLTPKSLWDSPNPNCSTIMYFLLCSWHAVSKECTKGTAGTAFPWIQCLQPQLERLEIEVTWGWNHSKAHSFACMTAAGWEDLSSLRRVLSVSAPCDCSGLLTAWWLGSVSKHPERTGKPSLSFMP